MAKIIVKRNSQWINKIRDIGIFINGELVGAIKDGKTQQYEVKSGEHEIYAKIDWCGSQKILIDAADNEIITIKLTGFKYGSWFLPIFLGIMLIYSLGKYVLNFNMSFLIVFGIVMFLYLLYFLTLGRNNYLTLKLLK
jgi:hypothetical protein